MTVSLLIERLKINHNQLIADCYERIETGNRIIYNLPEILSCQVCRWYPGGENDQITQIMPDA